jgi:deazaflavin-dependent oxidoreductase (nitroreductase family)
MLLTTIGRKSGKRRTVPVLYLRDGEEVVVVASGVGGARQPVWYLNLEANPEVEIEIGESRMRMTGRRATEEECADLWPKLIGMYRGFEGYRSRTEREIPLVILSPVATRVGANGRRV